MPLLTFPALPWAAAADILAENKPSWIHGLSLNKFQLGEKEPDIRNIRWGGGRRCLQCGPWVQAWCEQRDQLWKLQILASMLHEMQS